MERGGGLGGWTAEMTCSHDITSLFVSDAADKREVMEGCSDSGGGGGEAAVLPPPLSVCV